MPRTNIIPKYIIMVRAPRIAQSKLAPLEIDFNDTDMALITSTNIITLEMN